MSPPSSYTQCLIRPRVPYHSMSIKLCSEHPLGEKREKQKLHSLSMYTKNHQIQTKPDSVTSMHALAPTASSPASSSDHTSDTSGALRTKRSRVSAEHTLNRVRENQRRHRARQRDHVASLERKLAETERLLWEARQEIALLRQEAAQRVGYKTVSSAEGPVESTTPTSIITTITSITTAAGPPIHGQLSLPRAQQGPMISQDNYTDPFFFTDDSSSYCSPLSASTDTPSTSPPLPLPLPLPLLEPPTNGPPPCCSDTPLQLVPPSFTTTTPSPPADPECTSCKTRPPPSPTESTTLCAQAYVLIRQQNFRNLDPHTIRAWLVQGLRRAQRQGEGCRVENGALLRLLDFISGV